MREEDLAELEGSELAAEEEEGTDVSSVENPGTSLENAQWVQEDLELGLAPASVTTVTRLDTLLESAVLPGKEGSNANSGLYQTWKSDVNYYTTNCQSFKL